MPSDRVANNHHEHNVTDIHALSGVPRGRPTKRPSFLDQAQEEQHYERLRQQARRDRVQWWTIIGGIVLLLAGYCLGVWVAK
jgi:hypothetical protein